MFYTNFVLAHGHCCGKMAVINHLGIGRKPAFARHIRQNIRSLRSVAWGCSHACRYHPRVFSEASLLALRRSMTSFRSTARLTGGNSGELLSVTETNTAAFHKFIKHESVMASKRPADQRKIGWRDIANGHIVGTIRNKPAIIQCIAITLLIIVSGVGKGYGQMACLPTHK